MTQIPQLPPHIDVQDDDLLVVRQSDNKDHKVPVSELTSSLKSYSGNPILPYLNSANRTGNYRVSGVSDTPRASGIVVARLAQAGGLFGHAVFYSYGGQPISAIATCENGVWSAWKSVLLDGDVDVSLDAIAQNDARLWGGVPVKRDKNIIVGRGSYSWWCEPVVNLFGGVSQMVSAGCVGRTGVQKVLFSKPSSALRETQVANVNSSFSADEHNSPVAIEVDGDLFVFWTGHNDSGRIYMHRGRGLDPTALGKREIVYDDPLNSSTYVQAHYAQGKLIVFYRAKAHIWSMLVSEDKGDTWQHYPLMQYAGMQLYLLSKQGLSGGAVIRFAVCLNPTFTAENRLWECYLNLQDMRIRSGGNVIAELLNGDIANVPDMRVMYQAKSFRFRLFDMQYSGQAKMKMLVSDWGSAGYHTGEYRYLEYDLTTGAMVHDTKICNSGGQIGDGYHAGACFSDVMPGGGEVNASPVYSIRRDGSNYLFERYDSADDGASWTMAELIRQTDGAQAQMWRPRVPVGTRQSINNNQILYTWCEGRFTVFTDFDAVVMARLRFSDPD